MVVSRINGDIIFKETKTIHPEDKGHKSSVYSLTTPDKLKIAVLLGKPKYTFTEKGVIYFPIYAISGGTKIRGQIGVFELATQELTGAYKDGEVDIDRLDTPLFYSHANKKYLENINSFPTDYIGKTHLGKRELAEKINSLVEKQDKKNGDTDTDTDTDIDNDEFTLKLPIKKGGSTRGEEDTTILDHGIFEINEKMEVPELLEEETEQIAKEIKKGYRESSRNNWVEKFMKNNNYKVVDNAESSGDCFFVVVRDAFATIGKTTTVSKLRALLAREINDEVYMERRNLYLEFEGEIKECKLEIGELKKSLVSHKKRVEKSTQKTEEVAMLVENAKKIKEKQGGVEKRANDAERWQRECVGYMKNITTFEQMKDFIQTPSFWADEWAVKTVERACNIKFILFNEDAYHDGATDSILNCGSAPDAHEKGFRPDYYILVSYSNGGGGGKGWSQQKCGGNCDYGKHYRLITYKSRSIFKFREVPYDVKILVLQKCIEKNAGIYYLIQDFRNMKTEFGIDADEGGSPDFEDEIGQGDMYNAQTILIIGANAEKSARVGEANGEKIDRKRVVEFIPLSKIEDWRRKLDDKWGEAVLTIDGRKWASVEHYMRACSYKKGYPDIYAKYSLDSGSELSKDVKMIKTEKMKVAGVPVKPDDDYILGRDEEERQKALEVKFMEQEDMKYLLKSTLDALLLRKVGRGKPAEPDNLLMAIRKKL